MKKVIAILLSAFMAAALCSCSPTNTETMSNAQKALEEGDFETMRQPLDFYGLNFYNGLYDNADKAREVLGWKASRTLADMCRDTWNWQSSNPNGYEE